MIKIKILTEKKKKKQDRCAARAARTFDPYPSYNAASAIARCRRGEIWKKGKKSEGVNEEQNAAPLNKIQQHNLNILLQSEYSSKDKYSSNSIADNFVEDMVHQEFERTGDMDIYDSDGPDEATVMQELVQNVPALSKNKIIKPITGASFGKIFKMSDDHILKIFLGGVDVEDDIKWFNECYDRLHSGKATKTTLPVYSKPEWKAGLLPSYPDIKVGYVEMAEFIPLDAYMKRTGRSEADTVVSQTRNLFEMFYLEKGMRKLEQIISSFINMITPGKQEAFLADLSKDKSLYAKYADDIEEIGNVIKPFSRKEIISLITVFYDMLEMGFKLSDIAPRNMAVLKEDPETIIIFDR